MERNPLVGMQDSVVAGGMYTSTVAADISSTQLISHSFKRLPTLPQSSAAVYYPRTSSLVGFVPRVSHLSAYEDRYGISPESSPALNASPVPRRTQQQQQSYNSTIRSVGVMSDISTHFVSGFRAAFHQEGVSLSRLEFPPDALELLRQPIEAQRHHFLSSAVTFSERQTEVKDKQRRLEMLLQQQERREAWMERNAAATAYVAAMWTELAQAVRDRLTSLQPDGYQTFAFPQEVAVYEGNWKNCAPHGKGCLRRSFLLNDVYDGQWFVGQRCGTGMYQSSEFEFFYNGAWLDDKLHGKGELIEPEGLYTGEFVENSLHGFGEYIYNDGHVYRGDWSHGLYEGTGTYLYPSGTKYEGSWMGGREHGRGTLWYSNGDVYSGEWLHGLPHGSGTFISSTSNAARVTGQWSYGSLSGQASCVFADGSTYTGEWEQGVFHGEGCYAYELSNGERYEYKGSFFKGKRHGFGAFSAEHVAYSGEWVADEKVGVGSLRLRGGGIYRGEWKDDVPHGPGVYVSTGANDLQEVVTCEADHGVFQRTVDQATLQLADVRLLGRSK